MSFKPPYWHQGNIKFSNDEIKFLKSEIDLLGETKFAKNNMHISTFFIE